MRRSTALMSVAAVAIMASNAFAQGKANFAGTWNMVPDPNAAAMGGGGGGGGGGRGGRGGGGGGGACGGMTFTVVQDAKTLTCTRTAGQNEVKAVYNLDGSESKNSMMGRGGATEVVSKAKWDVDKIVIETPRTGPDGAVITTTQTLELDNAGVLWLSTTRPGQDGAPMTTKVQYKKA